VGHADRIHTPAVHVRSRGNPNTASGEAVKRTRILGGHRSQSATREVGLICRFSFWIAGHSLEAGEKVQRR
jgi:hypothetical protein